MKNDIFLDENLKIYLIYVLNKIKGNLFFIKLSPMTVKTEKCILKMIDYFFYPFNPLIYYFFANNLIGWLSSKKNRKSEKNANFYVFFDSRFLFYMEIKFLKAIFSFDYLYFSRYQLNCFVLRYLSQRNFCKYMINFQIIYKNLNFLLHINKPFKKIANCHKKILWPELSNIFIFHTVV